MNSKNKNIRDLYRGINDFKKGYQPRSNLVKDENGDLLADSHNNLFLRSAHYGGEVEITVHSVMLKGQMLECISLLNNLVMLSFSH
jgi:hypothetical protein